MPTQVGGEETPVDRIVDGGESRRGPSIEGGQVASAFGEDAVGDEQFA